MTATPSPQSGSLVLDDSLLEVLPPALDGTPVVSAPESFDAVRDDPDLVANVTAIAFFVVAGPGDLASGSVARLRLGVGSGAFWRDWRDSYNEGACAQAGGVVGNAQAELGGRITYITTCAQGLRVYHAFLEARGAIVSVFSVGDARFGERLVEGLRE